jgi:desulfoferrodoxin (superoxide reductase-like protein)
MSNAKQQGMRSSMTTVPADKREHAKQLLKEASHTRDAPGEYKDIAEWHTPVAEKDDEGHVRVQVGSGGGRSGAEGVTRGRVGPGCSSLYPIVTRRSQMLPFSHQVHQDHHPHKSTPAKEHPEHYVESIFVVDTESNEVAAYADFPPSFEHEYGPMLETTLSGKEKYVPYSYCNQHGLWKGKPF